MDDLNQNQKNGEKERTRYSGMSSMQRWGPYVRVFSNGGDGDFFVWDAFHQEAFFAPNQAALIALRQALFSQNLAEESDVYFTIGGESENTGI